MRTNNILARELIKLAKEDQKILFEQGEWDNTAREKHIQKLDRIIIKYGWPKYR
jgi:hypothetical protein